MPLIPIPFPDPPFPPVPEPRPPVFPPQLEVPPFPKPPRPPIRVPWFRECTPKILVVTDGLNFGSGDFGLSDFVATLRASLIHSMTPEVITAAYDPVGTSPVTYDATSKHIPNFRFADPTHGLNVLRYDVVFLFASALELSRDPELPRPPRLTDEPNGLAKVIEFMEAGGGLFATGDHEDLGAAMCMDIPRVRSMRHWRFSQTPSAGGGDRLTTNLPGANDVYEFGDQSDALPQRLFVNFRTRLGGIGAPHPLLQVPGASRAIEVFPDHPHEGECVVPANLTTTLPGSSVKEWPQVAGADHAPELVALTMSHGNGFGTKAAVEPRSFVAICAYDGHLAQKGRVVTDSTWHHFININVKPGLSALSGRDLTDIRQYFVNLATWLMPRSTRLCRRFPWILGELIAYPLWEELRPIPEAEFTAANLVEVGAAVEAALRSNHTRGEVDSLLADALEEGIGGESKRKLIQLAQKLNMTAERDASRAALGALTLLAARRFTELSNQKEVNGEREFLEVGKKASRLGAKHYLAHLNQELKSLGELLQEASK